MSGRKSIYKTIKKGLQDGVYRRVRLMQIKEGGERETIIPFNSNKGNENNQAATARLEHITHRIENILPPGNYIIEASAGQLNSALCDQFEIILRERITIPITTGSGDNTDKPEQLKEEEYMLRDLDLDEYKALIEENAKLKSQIEILNFKLSELEKNPPQSLQDNSPMGAIGKVLEETAPGIINLMDRFFDMRDKELGLRDRELSYRRGGKKVRRKKSKEQILEEFQQLEGEELDRALDALEIQEPLTYDFICEQLGLFEEEEERELQEGEEEEND